MSDPLSFMGGFDVFGNKLVDLLLKLRNEKVRRNSEAAQYFEDLSTAMTRVGEGLHANKVPRIDGNELQELIHAFPEKTKDVSLGHDLPVKASLDQVASIAKTLDGWLLINAPTAKRHREKMLAMVERIAGTCRGIAGVLKPLT